MPCRIQLSRSKVGKMLKGTLLEAQCSIIYSYTFYSFLIALLLSLIMHHTYISIGVLLATVVLVYKSYLKESVLLLPGIGLQHSIKYALGNRNETFVHWQNIDSVVIKEVVHLQKIVYILTVIVKNDSKDKTHLLLFTNLNLRLEDLELMYRDIHKLLESFHTSQ